ncbi:glycosyltransferase family 4 protein [Flammeovirga sp. SubArs3]|uniref:glycosyltransferase family 4 protein n=1 Tax=Flammeovirga sp. SubArs3 TaxID=2995316 RepID=UPI00248B54AD|nr:glycosyltransferase family 4 protein [Flammeovirga sp. SubArs3]
MFIVIEPYRFLPPTNGGHKACYHVCEEISKKTELTCITTTNNPELEIPFQVEKVFADKITKYINPFVGWKIYKSAKRLKATHILLNQPFMGLLMIPVARILGVKLLIFSHNIEFMRFKSMGKIWWPLMKALETFTYKNADQVLFISNEDKQFAMDSMNIDPNKCIDMPYGTSVNQFPLDIPNNKKQLYKEYHLNNDITTLFYFGPMDYAPNQKGLENLLYEIIPILRKNTDFKFHLFLAGKGLSEKESNYISSSNDITWLGFVDSLDLYIKGTDLMLNPIWIGGGVKIKLMESLSLGATAISYKSGSYGVNTSTLGEKIKVIPDQDAQAFSDEIIKLSGKEKVPTPNSFYAYHNWEKITDRILKRLLS